MNEKKLINPNAPADFTPSQNSYETTDRVSPFRMFCYENFPYIEQDFDAVTTYQLLQKVVEYLNKVIKNLNVTENNLGKMSENVAHLYNAYVQLQDYVNNYFNDLDVQTEINNKLDEMVQNGELQYLLNFQYDELKKEINKKIIDNNNEQLKLINNIDNKVTSATSGSPKGTYNTLQDLINDNPNHEYIYITIDNGNWNYFDIQTQQWKSGGIYQSNVNYSDLVNELNVSSHDFKYISKNILNDVKHYNGKSFPTSKIGLNINNYESKIEESTYAKYCTEPFRIRYSSGALIFKDFNFENVNNSSDADMLLYFDKDGKYLKNIKFNNPLKNIIDDNAYFVAFAQFKEFTEYKILNNQNIEVEWLNQQLKKDLNDTLNKINILSDNFKYKSLDILNDVIHYDGKTFPTSKNDLTVENFSTRIEPSKYVNYCTEPFRIRYSTGTLIFKDFNFENVDNSSDADMLLYFDKDGKYLKNIKFNNLSKNIIDDNAYFVAFAQFKTLSQYKILNNQNIEVEWLNNKVREDVEKLKNNSSFGITYVVDINGTGDFTSFSDCIKSLPDDDVNKTIIVKSGTYNIFEELGGSAYGNSVTAEDWWYDVSLIIPNNTKIIGKGNVVFNFLPELNEINEYGSSALSCLNVRGNIEIENIKCFAKNCRYVLHDETGDEERFYNKSKKYTNCEFHYLSGRPSGVGGTAIGNGFMKNMTYLYKNCIIDSKGKGYSISFHNGTVDGGANITFDNCYIIARNDNAYGIQLIANAKSNEEIKINVSNSYMNAYGINIIPQNQYLTIKNPYQFYINNSNNKFNVFDITPTDKFTNDKQPVILNTIK